MYRNKNAALLGILFIYSGLVAWGQTPAEELALYKKKYPGEHAVILDYKVQMNIDFKKGKWIIYTDFYQEILYLSKSASNYASDEIYYSSSFDKVSNIEAYTLAPDKKGYKKIPVTQFNTNDQRQNGIFHDDLKQISFYFPGLGEGHKTVLKYRSYDLEPHLLSKFNLYQYIPSEKISVKISVGKNAAVDIKKFRMDKYQGTFSEALVKNGTEYLFEMLQLKKTEPEDDQQSGAYLYPHIIPVIRYGISGKDTTPVLRNTNDLNTWMQRMAGKCERQDDHLLKVVVDSLTAEAEDTLEIIRNIYYWVHKNIHYIAFEDGLFGYVPHSSYDVYKHRYGDCKDMSNIIFTMLKIAGVECYLTTIGTRDLPYKVGELHAPMLFNHMIVALKYRDSFYFLDGTADFTPWNFVPEHIQDKECMVLMDDNKYRVLKTPIMDYRHNTLYDSVKITWNPQKLQIEGQGSLVSTGYYKRGEQSVLHFLRNDKDRFDNFVKQRYSRGNNKCIVDTAWFENRESISEPLKARYEFHVGDYAKILGNELYINPHLMKPYAEDEIKEDRKNPVERHFHCILELVSIVDIPEGYSLYYLPSNMKLAHERFNASITYTRIGNQIVCEQKYIEKNLVIENEIFADWNAIIKSLNKSYNEVIVFKKIN